MHQLRGDQLARGVLTMRDWDVYDSGYKTGKASAERDLSRDPLFAVALRSATERGYGARDSGPWGRGYDAGYRDAVRRWLEED